MSAQEYTLEEISYSRKEDRRIIEAVLKSWFKDPKTLNFVDPRMTFPFKFKKWVNLSYSNSNTSTLLLKIGDWIIGYISLVKIENIGHLFHLYIDPSNRGNGLGKKLIHAIEDRGMNL
jgi:ribosomal protein S18 acetylase RimI-like enzyme